MRLVGLAIVLACATAHADALDGATTAMHELRYADALRILDDAWHRGDNGSARVRAIFALAGQAAGSMGDTDAALLWFSRWLAVDPDAHLPNGTSPKLLDAFAKARASVAGASVGGRAVRDGDRIAVSITDPLALVASVRAGGARTDVRDGRASIAGDAASIELLDRYGNTLAELTVPDAAPVAVPLVRAMPRAWYERPRTWAIAAGGLAAIAGGAVIVAVGARSSLDDLDRASAGHQFSEATPVETRLERARAIADVAIGATVIAAAVGVVLYLRGDRVAVAREGIAWRF